VAPQTITNEFVL